jgi:hypothetical protein
MINARKVFAKVKLDQALNLSELAIASGYDRGVLGRMILPLQAKKMPLSDFKRLMRRRQAAEELENSKLRILPTPPAPSSPVNGDYAPSDADKFREPRKRNARPDASHPRDESRARSIA